MHSARNESNQSIDWWFAYKLPSGAKAPAGSGKQSPTSTGDEYLYFDSDENAPLQLSAHMLNDEAGALYHTMQQLYCAKAADSLPKNLGWIFYNDEIPETTKNDGTRGHTKGVLSFDTDEDSAFWLLHSVPRFPHPETADFPADEHIYGQTFLCITLKNIDAAQEIAAQMLDQHEPQVYDVKVPDSLQGTPLDHLSKGVRTNSSAEPSDTQFQSHADANFRLLAKNRHWGKDFWIDLVGPALKVDLNIETWRRGTLPGTKDSDNVDCVEDVQYIDLSPLNADYEWKYTKDHAKWAVSTTDDWVCVADINRQTSQEKRGGGAICFQNQKLWAALSQIDRMKV